MEGFSIQCVGLEQTFSYRIEQAEISQGKEEIPTKMGPHPITKIWKQFVIYGEPFKQSQLVCTPTEIADG